MSTKVQNPEIVSVSFDQLLKVLNEVEKGQMMSCRFITDPNMNTGGRRDKVSGEYPNKFVGRVKKVTSGTFTCGNSYVDRIKKQMIKDGLDPNTWVVEKSKVGEHVSKCVTYNENTDNYQFQLEFHPTNPFNHVQSHFLVDGQTIDQFMFEQFEQYLVKHSVPQKQVDCGITKPILLFSPSVKNFKEVTLDHVRYVLQD